MPFVTLARREWSAARRASSMAAQGNALGLHVSTETSPEGTTLIPDVSFINFDLMPSAKFTQLVLERHPFVMFFLLLDVLPDLRNV